ncbi:hypothetical protein ALC57_03568, partial [Trachymyrmex cornetzi]
ISKDDLKGFRYSTLLVDHSAIDFRSLFKAEHAAPASKTKILKSKGPRTLGYTREINDMCYNSTTHIYLLKHEKQLYLLFFLCTILHIFKKITSDSLTVATMPN